MMTLKNNHIAGGFAAMLMILSSGSFAAPVDNVVPVSGERNANVSAVSGLEGVNTWTDAVPLPPGIEVSDSGRARDGKGYYLNGIVDSNLRRLTTYYERQMAALGWTQSFHERAPGRTLRVAYIRGNQKLVLNFAVVRQGALVSMVVGPYATRQARI